MLPAYVSRAIIQERLQKIFPEGTPHRNYCVRDTASATVFVMLYIGAIEGTEIWLAPKHVMRMTEEQAAIADDENRKKYESDVMRPKFSVPGRIWYAENSRESVRDETIRQGLIGNNAIVERAGLPTTSGKPRYALRSGFASLFDPNLKDERLAEAIEAWQASNLSASARARVTLMRRGAVTTGEGVLVTFPNGETRRMAPGPSSVISKAVIEIFAARFLVNPAVLWVSESGAKVVARDDDLAKSLNLKISTDRTLPDIILVDLGTGEADQLILVFIEVVATDGPITAKRREEMLKIANDGGFPEGRVAFVTAYLDRAHQTFKRSVPELAWRSFAWFAAEEDKIVLFADNGDSGLPIRKLISP